MVKIDVISGFLGAGKTTFANILLEYYLKKKEKAVYIVNEFGNTGIDAKIINYKGFKSIEMANGCICCTLKDDIAITIKEVIKNFEPSRIVFEPSGVFVFDNFFEIVKDIENCEIGNVITIIDGINYNYSKLIAGSFIYNQIKNSPILIISKIEHIKEDLKEIICDLKNVNENSLVIAENWNRICQILSNILWDDYKQDKKTQVVTHEKLQTVTVKLNRNFSITAINKLITKIKTGEFGQIFRVKGVIKIDSVNHLLNISFNDATIEKARNFDNCSLTFIGKILNKEKIKRIYRVTVKKKIKVQ